MFVYATFMCVILNIVDWENDARSRAGWSGRMGVRHAHSEVTAPPPVNPAPEPGTSALSDIALAPLWANRRQMRGAHTGRGEMIAGLQS